MQHDLDDHRGRRPVEEPVAEVQLAESDRSRRHYDRVIGPFDGCHVGTVDTPIRIYNISLGGCLVISAHEQRDSSSLVLRIDLPHEGWITIKAETVHRIPGFGFGVRFIELDADTCARVGRTVDALKDQFELEWDCREPSNELTR